MITHNQPRMDNEDVAVLFAAICEFDRAHGETLDTTMANIGYAELMNRASLAAAMIGCMVGDKEGAEWDGVVWFERLEDYGWGDMCSLAGQLYMLLPTYDVASDGEIEAIVRAWLSRWYGV